MCAAFASTARADREFILLAAFARIWQKPATPPWMIGWGKLRAVMKSLNALIVFFVPAAW